MKRKGYGIMRLGCLAMALCLVLGCVTAAAEGAQDAPIYRLYTAGAKTLTETDNVTVRVTADFCLDGKAFKHAEGILAQAGEDSYQEIRLETPREGAEPRKNGYAVYLSGGEGYSVERWGRWVIPVTIYDTPKESLFRPRIGEEALISLGSGIAEQLDRAMAGTASSEKGENGEEISLTWAEGQIPDLVSGGLNILWQYLVDRYRVERYNDMKTTGYAAIEDYFTVTDGIVYCTRRMTLRRMALQATLDTAGRMTRMAGQAALGLTCRNGDEREMTVTFDFRMEDYGATKIDEVVPEDNRRENLDWNGPLPPYMTGESVMESLDQVDWSVYGLPAIPKAESRLIHREIGSLEDAAAYADEIAAMDALGLEGAERLQWSVIGPEEDCYHALGAYPDNPDHPVISVMFRRDGQVLRFENYSVQLESAVEYDGEELERDYMTGWREAVGKMLWQFTENINPGVTGLSEEQLAEGISFGNGYSSYSGDLRIGDEKYLVLYAVWNASAPDRARFIVQTAPEFRVVLMDATIDPEEGGNG